MATDGLIEMNSIKNLGKLVPVDNTPLLKKRAWELSPDKLECSGYYRTRYGAWKGKIRRRGDEMFIFIQYPPLDRIASHPEWRLKHHCFWDYQGDMGEGWFRFHLQENPANKGFNVCIGYMERILCDVLKG